MIASPLASVPENSTFAALKAELDARAGGRIIASAPDALSSGLPELDQALGGGYARGTLVSLEGPAGCSGRTAVLAATLAGITGRGLAAIVEAPFAGGDGGRLYPPDLARSGVVLDRTLFAQANSAIEIARCADVLLRSKAFAAVAMPAAALRATVWSRLCGLAQKSGAVLFALGSDAGNELAYFASTRIRCGMNRVVWHRSGVLGELRGYEIDARVLKHRRASPGAVAHLHAAAAHMQ